MKLNAQLSSSHMKENKRKKNYMLCIATEIDLFKASANKIPSCALCKVH